MKMKTILLIMFVMIGILPYTAAATPGINLTAEPISGTTVDYLVTINNMDDGYYKIVSLFDVSILPTGWTYTFNPDPIGQIIPAGNGEYITTTLQITAPAGTAHNFPITVEAQYEMWPGSGAFGVYGTDRFTYSLYVVVPETTPIPEFPTIALPVLSVMGLMLVFGRRRDNL